ncbi:MAG: cysteine peptidase family C39 domain-containing protein, partial [Betaproteobacteria bacterium]|nr:cysteine peptidase family C39 domain-containing protein [Betaproteobacteria bacterium]
MRQTRRRTYTVLLLTAPPNDLNYRQNVFHTLSRAALSGKLQTPCILHWDLNHFVVLKCVLRNGAGIIIHDPARGELKVPAAEVSTRFTGVALELTPTPRFEKKEEKQRLRLREMMGSVVGLKRSLAQILLLAIALEVFALVSPFLMQWVVDGAILSADRDLLTLLVL